METRKKRTKVVVSVLVLAGLVVFALTAVGGDLEPNAPPGPTMKTLDEIYDAVASGMFESEGYCQYFESNYMEVPPLEILTVPAGKRFVLRKLYVRLWRDGVYKAWDLKVDGNVFIHAGWLQQEESPSTGDRFMHDFPDGCVVVNAGQTLSADKPDRWHYLNILVIGYFYDIQ